MSVEPGQLWASKTNRHALVVGWPTRDPHAPTVMIQPLHLADQRIFPLREVRLSPAGDLLGYSRPLMTMTPVLVCHTPVEARTAAYVLRAERDVWTATYIDDRLLLGPAGHSLVADVAAMAQEKSWACQREIDRLRRRAT